ncbi:MAG: hypothetical protein DRN20_06620 [Thermoplasmata archaeon]|nr:MAG: hypothetical protein DRN20_06620 [Thermoplasmata archaeon]
MNENFVAKQNRGSRGACLKNKYENPSYTLLEQHKRGGFNETKIVFEFKKFKSFSTWVLLT